MPVYCRSDKIRFIQYVWMDRNYYVQQHSEKISKITIKYTEYTCTLKCHWATFKSLFRCFEKSETAYSACCPCTIQTEIGNVLK